MGAENTRNVLQIDLALAQRLKLNWCILPLAPNNVVQMLSLQETSMEQTYAEKSSNVISS
jgi:hypothetical protein